MSAPQKPHVVPIEIEGIPQVLKSIAQWTCWSYSWIADDEKWTKVPVQASDPQRKASSTNPETWGTLEQAVASYEAGLVDGIGFVLTSDDPFTVIDVDHCID
jgi:putative DNA primase/helicase